jgi:lipopolysaccharide/colanic/teichoic acid biosynthesis glycosyltransferase
LKRTFDLVAASLGLLLTLPILAIVAILVKLGSKGPVFFRQKRIGRRFQPFELYKFRTMVPGAQNQGPTITAAGDPRVTGIGRILRSTKLDEFPQLLNVIRGEMSLVGPRPEVAQYVEMFRSDYREILEARPGITDLASIKYRDEAGVLARAANPEAEYVNRILPEKINLAREYVRQTSMGLDLKVIGWTLISIVRPPDSPSPPPS